ncbi:MAG: transposase [Caldilineaceae bacterium SB0661_bin_34]|nr:transposase [Caldilineaceae bacterium SB0661_bin_34]
MPAPLWGHGPGGGLAGPGGLGGGGLGPAAGVLSVLDLKEHCSYPVHGCLQPSSGPRTRRSVRRTRPPRAAVTAMLALLDEALAVDPEQRPDIRVFVGDSHYACEPMVAGLAARGLVLVSKLRRDAVLWVLWQGPPTGRPGRPRKYAGRFDRTRLGELPAVDLPDEGTRLYHAPLYYKPFQKLLRVVFVLDADADPAEDRPTILFGTDPEMDPARTAPRGAGGPGPLFDGQRQAQGLPRTGVGQAFCLGRVGPDPAKISGGPAGTARPGPNRAQTHLKRQRIHRDSPSLPPSRHLQPRSKPAGTTVPPPHCISLKLFTPLSLQQEEIT